MSIISLHAVLWPAASSPRRISEDGQPARDAGLNPLYDRDLHPAPVPFNRSTSAFIGRHQRTRICTPRHNGKVERYQRLMTDECLYARAYATENERRDAIKVWAHHYDYHRPHTACSDQPPASRLHIGVDNVMANYT